MTAGDWHQDHYETAREATESPQSDEPELAGRCKVEAIVDHRMAGRLKGIMVCIVIITLARGCAATEKKESAPRPGITEAEADRIVRDQQFDDETDKYEATSWAAYTEGLEIDAWNDHLEDMEAEGQDAANDPSLNQDPAAYDCEDFDFQEEVVAFFWGAGGPEVDPFWLDDDQDEVPCELLPRWQPGVDW